MRVSQVKLVVETEPPIESHGNSIRGFFAGRSSSLELLHNHSPTGKPLYLYPRVQYKTIQQTGVIIGIDEGCELVQDLIKNLTILELGQKEYAVRSRQLTFEEVEFGLSDSPKDYELIKPWLALNEKNHKKFENLSQGGRDEMLKKILIGNLLSISKSLGYVVDEQLSVSNLSLRDKTTYLKSVPMIGFTGQFSVNFSVPNFWGIGKSVSRGFGTVQGINRKE